MKIQKIVMSVLLVGVLALSGCAGRLLKLDPSYLGSSKKIVIMWSESQPHPVYIREGQGLLDAVVSEVTKAPFVKNIESFDLTPVVAGEFARLWKPLLDKKSISYHFLPESVDLEMYKADHQDANDFSSEVKLIPGVGNADYVVLLQVLKFNVHHSHALLGVIATAAPAVKFNYRLVVIRTSDNQMIAEGFGDKSVSMKEGWEKGPEYLGIYEAMVTAFSEGMTDIYTKVIGK